MDPEPRCSICGQPLRTDALGGRCMRCVHREVTRNRPIPFIRATSLAALFAGQQMGPHQRFTLIERLEESAAGAVWLAIDYDSSREGEPAFVALRFSPDECRTNAQVLAAVRAEVPRLRRLRHSHLAVLYDFHALRDEMPFFHMEFVEGFNLHRRLQSGGPLPWTLAATVVRQVGDALHHAHTEVGIVHGDIQPAHLVLDGQGRAKLTDFGCTRLCSPGKQGSPLRGPGPLAHFSPQQLAGAIPQASDDVYSLGATFYELLTGTPIYSGSPDEVIRQVETGRFDSLADRLASRNHPNEVPPQVAALIARCLDRDPRNRPTARELVEGLPDVPANVAQFGPAQPPVDAGAAVPQPGSSPPAERLRRAWLLWAAVLAALAVGLTLALKHKAGNARSPQPPKPPPARSKPTAQTSIDCGVTVAPLGLAAADASLALAFRTHPTHSYHAEFPNDATVNEHC
jgi:eukaryotic-like serine/threonine-protein kinase